MSQLQVLVNQDVPRAASEGSSIAWKGSKRGEACVIDFYTAMALEGRGFQIKAGTISIPLVGDAPLADQVAEFCVDAGQGLVVMPVYCNISINVGTGTVHEYGIKSVDAVSTSGAVFIPLRLLGDTNGAAAVATGRVAAAGGVAVAAEAATTTRRYWARGATIAVAAGHSITTHDWQPKAPPAIANDATCYVQIGATTTGPSYFAHLDFLEMPWVNVS